MFAFHYPAMLALVTVPMNLQSAGKVEKADQTIQIEKADAEPDKGAKATTGKFYGCSNRVAK